MAKTTKPASKTTSPAPQKAIPNLPSKKIGQKSGDGRSNAKPKK